MRGIAKNDPAIEQWLDQCPAVESFTKTEDRIDFKFDPHAPIPEDIPDGVFFDLSASPF